MTPPAPMTPERWRAVDAVLRGALSCEPARRDAFVAEACAEDEGLRGEVASLLAAHDRTGDDFLERPAAELLEVRSAPPPLINALGAVLHEMLAGQSPAPSTSRADVPPSLDAAVPRRMVSALAAVYAATAMVAIGLVGGWVLASSSLPQRWETAASGAAGRLLDAGAAPNPAIGEHTLLTVVDRAGRPHRTIAANRPWTPRISPDGRLLAYGAFGAGRSTSDLWVTDLGAGTTRRLTDDGNDSNDPQWSADGATVAYSASAPGGKDLLSRQVGGGEPSVLAAREGTQYASDWLRDGSALLVTEDAGRNRSDILIQPVDGSTPWPYAATDADETAGRVSPDGRWVAYTSDESGRAEVYLDSYPRPRQRISMSSSGGVHPVWRRDGRELYYWSGGALVAVRLGAAAGDAPPAIIGRTVLFRAPYHVGPNTMYDVSPDGERFAIVQDARTSP